jgi:16S rRNA (cytosine967-C5)-methyltransferase
MLLSILPSENQDQIAKFLATTDIGKVQLRQRSKILASESGFDGFYMALLERKEEILKPKK